MKLNNSFCSQFKSDDRKRKMEEYNVEERFTESGRMTESFKKDVLDYADKFVKYHLNNRGKVEGCNSENLDKAAKEFAGNNKPRLQNKNKCKML